MYLSKKTYVKRWGFQSPEEAFKVSVEKGGEPYPSINQEKISYITEEVMYWRKANQIHGWFCNNCEERTPDVDYSVSRKDLEELLTTCKSVLEILDKSPITVKQVNNGWKNNEPYMVDVETYDCKEQIEELLPPTQGFFFGSYEIDNWYRDSIEETIKVLEEELSTPETYEVSYEYYASW